jgi:hypothetical protein
MTNAEAHADLPPERSRFWRYARTLAVPLLLWVLVIVALRQPLQTWLHFEESYDEAALQEWLEEARGYQSTLREMIDEYLARASEYVELRRQNTPREGEQARELRLRKIAGEVAVKHGEISEQLETLGVPPTKRYSGQLPLFPIIYRLQVRFQLEGSPLAELSSVRLGANGFLLDAPITWDSGLPSD